MKTVGEILKNARQQKGLTLNEVSALTKIEVKYLKALEENDYDRLPPATFTKGFIRNFAEAVDRSANDLVAIFRRDYTQKREAPRPASASFSIARSFSSIPKTTFLLVFVGLFTFSSYLAFQYRSLLIPPPLEITQPQDQAVVHSPLAIEGRTSPDSLVTIDDETDVKPDQSGVFFTQLHFSPGEHELKITATNRFSRTATKTIIFTVLSSD